MDADFCEELELRQRLLRSQLEIARLQARLVETETSAGRTAESETEMRHAVEAAEARLHRLESSLLFRLGALIVDLGRSPRGWLSLPSRCVRQLGQLMSARQGGESTKRATALHQSLATVEIPEKVRWERAVEAGAVEALPKPPPLPDHLSDLHVAAILDPFSMSSLEPECRLMPLHPERWLSQIRSNPPHMLLVESAWTGKDGEWADQVEHAPPLLSSVVASCRKAGIPTVFWNKEDPLHFEAFLPTARLFDHVFTTDASSVPRYLRELGHRRVGLLTFALQPRTHHPFSEAERQEASVFAGAWYADLPERCSDFEAIADALSLAGSFVIHDRLSGRSSGRDRFPAKYSRNVRPPVPYAQTPVLFRRYRIGVNLNTIKQSPTMFARRVLELVGCNASVYGNHSLALRRLFGDLTVSSDDPERLLEEAFNELREPDAPRYRQRRLRALRKVLREHTWQRRLSSIASAAFGSRAPVPAVGRVWVLARVQSQEELARVEAAFSAQHEVRATLVLDMPNSLPMPRGAVSLETARIAVEDWLAVFHPSDHYGSHYLEDLTLARAFGPAPAIGKGSWWTCGADGSVSLRETANEYRILASLHIRRCLFQRAVWAGTLAEVLDAGDGGTIEGEGLFSVDALGYLENGAERGLPEWEGPALDEGVSLQEIEALVGQLAPAPDANAEEADALDGTQLSHLFNCGVVPSGTSASVREGRLEVCSLLKEGEEDTLLSAPIARDSIERGGVVRATLQAPPASQLNLYLHALDANGVPLKRAPLPRGVTSRLVPPDGTAAYRLTARVKGGFVRSIDGLWLARYDATPLVMPGKGRVLLACPGYPEHGRLDRYGFVHRRVLAYRALGIGVDVVWVSAYERPRSYEYEGVPVRVCDPVTLAATLRISEHAAIAVHSLDATLWQAVGEAAESRRVVAWLYAEDLQPPPRQPLEQVTQEARADAEGGNEARMEFWRELLSSPPARLHLVFASNTCAEQVWENLGLRLPEERWSVIQDPIDPAPFLCEPKPLEQRFRVLVLYPREALNDVDAMVVDTIHQLSSEPVFQRLEFCIVGHDLRIEERLCKLKQYTNIRLRCGLHSEVELAGLYRDYGILLAFPCSSLGGSLHDEALARGMVPVTSIAERPAGFVRIHSAGVDPTHDGQTLARKILQLTGDPIEFGEKSRAAGLTLHGRDIERIVAMEIDVISMGVRDIEKEHTK